MNYNAVKTFILDQLDKNLSEQLSYHGKHHTLDVLQVAEELCQLEGINDEESLILVKTAALFHDAGFTVAYTNHEENGCQLAQEKLPHYGYSSDQINRICGMIMATKIPQSPQTHLEAIICDADLDYLGRNDFYDIGATLFKELKAHQILEDEKKWNQIQVNFLKSHTFHTYTNIKRRHPVKAQYLAELEALVATY